MERSSYYSKQSTRRSRSLGVFFFEYVPFVLTAAVSRRLRFRCVPSCSCVADIALLDELLLEVRPPSYVGIVQAEWGIMLENSSGPAHSSVSDDTSCWQVPSQI